MKETATVTNDETKNETISHSSERVAYYDVLRILATAGVVMLHTASKDWHVTDVFSSEWEVYNFWDCAVRWSVPVFVMISGALFLDPERTIPVKKIYTKYILRIVVAFLFWSVLYAAYSVWNNPQLSRREIISMVLVGHYHMWYLWMIVGLYAITPLLRMITAHGRANFRVVRYFLILAFFFTFLIPTIQNVLAVAQEVYPESEGLAIAGSVLASAVRKMDFHFTLGFTAYFVGGYYLSRKNIPSKSRIIIYCLAIAGFAGTCLAVRASSRIRNAADETFLGNFNPCILLESVGIFVFVKYRKFRGKRWKSGWIRRISADTFGIYLVHALIQEILANQFHFTAASIPSGLRVLSVPIVAALIFGIGLGISALMHRIPLLRRWVV